MDASLAQIGIMFVWFRQVSLFIKLLYHQTGFQPSTVGKSPSHMPRTNGNCDHTPYIFIEQAYIQGYSCASRASLVLRRRPHSYYLYCSQIPKLKDEMSTRDVKTAGASVSKMPVSTGIKIVVQSSVDILLTRIQAAVFGFNWQPCLITRISCFYPLPGARLRLKLFPPTVFIDLHREKTLDAQVPSIF